MIWVYINILIGDKYIPFIKLGLCFRPENETV